MRAGRLATLAVAGMLVVSGLAGCQAKPTVAAYVDDVVITEAQVDAVMDELRASLEEFSENWFAQEEQRLAAAEELTDAEREAELAALRQREDERLQRELATRRDQVVQLRVLTEAARRYAQQQQVEVAEPALEAVAEQVGLPADHAYVTVVAESFAVMTPLQGTVTPVEPSEADQREVYDRLVAAGQTSVPFAEAQQVLTADVLGEAVAIRNLFREILDGVKVRVNPRYDAVYQVPVEFPGGQTWLAVPLSDSAVDR